ncbi:hypothetical protein WJX74_000425 [Apatococcus lobatus]|uniref:PHD finger-like domain-containing protein 5A n=1 Tax=Apatococcus lobatus TaxID=904363 RepID=A0AAW1SFF2_9CHLO
MCRKQPGIAIGRLCDKCDGKCVVCDSYVRPCTLVRICDECNYGSYAGRCVICGGVGISDAYYCKECTQQEKDRDGCPKIAHNYCNTLVDELHENARDEVFGRQFEYGISRGGRLSAARRNLKPTDQERTRLASVAAVSCRVREIRMCSTIFLALFCHCNAAAPDASQGVLW